jgi:hypothetical protein
VLPVHQQSGSWTTSTFVTTGAWSVGWAYSCSSLTSGSAFQVYRLTTGVAAGPISVVRAVQASGSGVTTVATPGSEELQVEENPDCQSAVKVTEGSATP